LLLIIRADFQTIIQTNIDIRPVVQYFA